MLSKFKTTCTRPADSESFARALSTSLFVRVVKLIGMFATALEVLRAMDGKVTKIQAFTVASLAFNLSSTAIEVVMHFVRMVTETFR